MLAGPVGTNGAVPARMPGNVVMGAKACPSCRDDPTGAGALRKRKAAATDGARRTGAGTAAGMLPCRVDFRDQAPVAGARQRWWK